MNETLDPQAVKAMSKALGVTLTDAEATASGTFAGRMLAAAAPAFRALPFQSEPAGHAAMLIERAP